MQISVLPSTCMQQRQPQRVDHGHITKKMMILCLSNQASLCTRAATVQDVSRSSLETKEAKGTGVQRCGGHPSQVRQPLPSPTWPQSPQQLQVPWNGIPRFGIIPGRVLSSIHGLRNAIPLLCLSQSSHIS